MKQILALIVILFCTNAYADFAVGAGVGVYSVNKQNSTTLWSDSKSHSIIMCETSDPNVGVDIGKCKKIWIDQGNIINVPRGWNSLTPGQYAAYLGFRYLYRQGIMIDKHGTVFILMDVSK